MNKKYIDFVPSKSAKKATVAKKAVRVTGVGVATTVARRANATAMRAKSIKGGAKASVKPSVTNGARVVKGQNSAIKEMKAKKVGLKEVRRGRVAAVEKPVEKSIKTEIDKKMMAIPRAQFINQNKVEKRPLSKNVYQKKIEATVEVPTGPVTIISKPDKDRHVSVVVTIIITIILGAAAGTVAFLLLPK